MRRCASAWSTESCLPPTCSRPPSSWPSRRRRVRSWPRASPSGPSTPASTAPCRTASTSSRTSSSRSSPPKTPASASKPSWTRRSPRSSVTDRSESRRKFQGIPDGGPSLGPDHHRSEGGNGPPAEKRNPPMKKNRKRIAAAGLAVTGVLGGGVAGLMFGPVAAGAAAATTSTTAAATAAPAPPPKGVIRPNDPAVVAGALGMSEADLRTALQSGKLISQVASDKGVDIKKVTDALAAADTKAIDQAVTDGKLTAAQAADMKANLAAHVQDEVTRTGPGGPGGRGHGGPGMGAPDGVARPNDAAVAAGALGMSEADLRTALQGGKSISQV